MVNKAKVPSKRIMHLWTEVICDHGECKFYLYGKGRSRSLRLMSERELNSDSTSGGILAGIMKGAGAPTHYVQIQVYQHTCC